MRVTDYLGTGTESAVSGKELANMLGINIRNLTMAIERERREGEPICAKHSGKNHGYFLASNKAEMDRYCRQLNHRVKELSETHMACKRSMYKLPD